MLHDITLDGNTFKSSHSVEKRPTVADIGFGMAITRGPWKLAFARYHRTREFAGQRTVPVFGSVTLSRRF
ncbi:lipid A deacylase LpxR family protein [Paucibacter sp. O1-1]|nr:lipid A deacylase LpxR family protein [Paucibacter sp. O1-1]MDA3825014.1 lipid A deacylase LpxR family protein [Paucibacter sp. O1-1]